eukprot:TRINITY_DN3580_c2_g2_i2.p2 TRINITY_DN3580_c2_g2~~TRINITY_DN3580_c2_g2_i2.p2  ORF type:complete len:184 (-),score=15.10 TRINITY_DN3580_c2_g2_i2:627-1127(-)
MLQSLCCNQTAFQSYQQRAQQFGIWSKVGRLQVHRRCVLEISAKIQTRTEKRQQKHRRIRGTISGTPERPRMAVHKSGSHLYAQVIDDTVGNTLVFVTTLQKDVKAEIGDAASFCNIPAAQVVGKKIAEKCLEKNIEEVCFDRGGHMYHGKIKAIADAAREAGLSL